MPIVGWIKRTGSRACAIAALVLLAALPVVHLAAGDLYAEPIATIAFFALVLAVAIPQRDEA